MYGLCQQKDKEMKRFLLVLGIFLADQLSKSLILWFYPEKVIFNKGIVLSFFPSDLWLSVSFLLIFLIWFLGKNYWFCWLIIGGGMANLFDRLFRGGIVDFINLKIWPVFNLADIAITIGIIFYLLFILRHYKSKLDF